MRVKVEAECGMQILWQLQDFKIDGGMQVVRQTITDYRFQWGGMGGFSQKLSGRMQD